MKTHVEAKKFPVRKLVAGASVMVGALGVAGCEASDNRNSNNYCAVPLAGNLDSINKVVDRLSHDDPNYHDDAVLRDGNTGRTINLSTNNPYTSQHPGDIVVAKGVSVVACDNVDGQYYVHSVPPLHPEATPPATTVIE